MPACFFLWNFLFSWFYFSPFHCAVFFSLCRIFNEQPRQQLFLLSNCKYFGYLYGVFFFRTSEFMCITIYIVLRVAQWNNTCVGNIVAASNLPTPPSQNIPNCLRLRALHTPYLILPLCASTRRSRCCKTLVINFIYWSVAAAHHSTH